MLVPPNHYGRRRGNSLFTLISGSRTTWLGIDIESFLPSFRIHTAEVKRNTRKRSAPIDGRAICERWPEAAGETRHGGVSDVGDETGRTKKKKKKRKRKETMEGEAHLEADAGPRSDALVVVEAGRQAGQGRRSGQRLARQERDELLAPDVAAPLFGPCQDVARPPLVAGLAAQFGRTPQRFDRLCARRETSKLLLNNVSCFTVSIAVRSLDSHRLQINYFAIVHLRALLSNNRETLSLFKQPMDDFGISVLTFPPKATAFFSTETRLMNRLLVR